MRTILCAVDSRGGPTKSDPFSCIAVTAHVTCVKGAWCSYKGQLKTSKNKHLSTQNTLPLASVQLPQMVGC